MNLKEGLFLARLNLSRVAPILVLALLSFGVDYYLFLWVSPFLNLFFVEFFSPLGLHSIRLAIWVLLFLVFKNLTEWCYKFSKRGKYYEFIFKDWPSKWIHHGGIRTIGQPAGLKIRNTASGCLLKKYLWRDFEMSFEMKYLSDETPLHFRSLGVLLRAANLESYYMFEIAANKDSGDLFVKPHIRHYGKWEFVDWEKVWACGFNDFFRVKFRVNNRNLKFFINGSLKYEWILPDMIDFRGEKQQEPQINKGDDKDMSITVLEVPFINQYGMIGFRADWGQGAVVKNIKVKTLSQFDSILFSNL